MVSTLDKILPILPASTKLKINKFPGPQFTGLQHVNDMSGRNSPIAKFLGRPTDFPEVSKGDMPMTNQAARRNFSRGGGRQRKNNTIYVNGLS
jgi:hypothetical protein